MNQLAGYWSDIFARIPAAATANAIALAWTPIVGSPPAVMNRGTYYEVMMTPDQEDRAVAWIESQLNKEPGPVRMNLSGIGTKVIFREYWPEIAGIAAIGAVLGIALAGRRRRNGR